MILSTIILICTQPLVSAYLGEPQVPSNIGNIGINEPLAFYMPVFYFLNGCPAHAAVGQDGRIQQSFYTGTPINNAWTALCNKPEAIQQIYGHSAVYGGNQAFVYAWYSIVQPDGTTIQKNGGWSYVVVWLNGLASADVSARSQPTGFYIPGVGFTPWSANVPQNADTMRAIIVQVISDVKTGPVAASGYPDAQHYTPTLASSLIDVVKYGNDYPDFWKAFEYRLWGSDSLHGDKVSIRAPVTNFKIQSILAAAAPR